MLDKSTIEEKRALDKPHAFNNFSGLGEFMFWLYKQNLDLVEEAAEDRRRTIELLERIAREMDGLSRPQVVVVVHEEDVEEPDSGLLSRVKRLLKA